MSRTIRKYDPYSELRKPISKPGYAIESDKYSKKKIRQMEKREIEKQLNSRCYPYEEEDICDLCGGEGAFDLYGDYICMDCLGGREDGK